MATAWCDWSRQRQPSYQEELDWRLQPAHRIIVNALLALMQEKLYDRIMLQEIIDRADISSGTF